MQSQNRNGAQESGVVRRGRLDRVRRSVGTHRALFTHPSERRCDLCDASIPVHGDGGSGLYIWTRSGEIRYEEPPLCVTCGPALALTAMRRWEEEDEEEG
jgi:hypothetical protein